MGEYREDNSHGIAINFPKNVKYVPSDYRYAGSEPFFELFDFEKSDQISPSFTYELDTQYDTISGEFTHNDVASVIAYDAGPINLDGVIPVYAKTEIAPGGQGLWLPR